MASIRDRILDAVLTVLNTGTPVGVPASTREVRIYEQAQLPSIVVRPVGENVSQVHDRKGLLKERQLRFVVEVRAAGAVPDKALDKHLVWVTKKLDGYTNALFNDLLEEGDIAWIIDMQDFAVGMAVVPYIAYYQTKKGDQETKN